MNNAAATLDAPTFSAAVGRELVAMQKKRVRGKKARHIIGMINMISKFYFGVEAIVAVSTEEFETMEREGRVQVVYDRTEAELRRDA